MWSVPSSPSPRQQFPPPPSSIPIESSEKRSVLDSPPLDSSFLFKDGREIKVGDCALFQAGNSPPFIGIIRSLTGDKISVNWLYRPADVKLAKGIVEAAPNEVFYSFHKDTIPAASLLHPCKVAFLRKGVELPPGVSSFVCRRLYDISAKCLVWLTERDFIDERQEELDKLLEKTRQEMHGQSGGRSPKALNGPASTQHLKNGPENAQNSSTSFPSQGKGKKRDRSDHGSELAKRERGTKLEDGDSADIKTENTIKELISRITEKGGLASPEGVEKLVNFMQVDKTEKKVDVSGRILVADTIAATDREDCLSKFVQLKGVPILDDWLQETHKGKTADGSSPKESDSRGAVELLLALLRALDKLPVDLHALQTCQIGKSVNHLRTHKNSEIHKKAKSLVETWKRRVDLEMNKINDAKSVGPGQPVSVTGKQGCADGSGNKRVGTVEVSAKNPAGQPSANKNPSVKSGQTEFIVKSAPVISGSVKSTPNVPTAVAVSSKEMQAAVKEEKSSSSSHSENNSMSFSSDHAKTTGSSWKEDARSSSAGSRGVTKRHSSSSHHRRSSNGLLGASSGVQKETNMDHANGHRIIVRLPNPGRSPAHSVSGGSFEDLPATGSRASSPGVPDKPEHTHRRMKLRSNTHRSHVGADVKMESWESNDVKEGLLGMRSSAIFDEQSRTAEDSGKDLDALRTACSSSGNDKEPSLSEQRSRNIFSSIHALIEGGGKYSEACASMPVGGDDIGMNLLASVATGEICKSELLTPNGSPMDSPASEDPCVVKNEEKARLSCNDDVAQSHAQSDEVDDAAQPKEESTQEESSFSAVNTTTLPTKEDKLLVKETEQTPMSTGACETENCVSVSHVKLEDDRSSCLPVSKSLEVKDLNNEASQAMDKKMSGQILDNKPIMSSEINTSDVARKNAFDGQDSTSCMKSEMLAVEEPLFSAVKDSQRIRTASDQQVGAGSNDDDAVVVKADESVEKNRKKQDISSLTPTAAEDPGKPSTLSHGNTGTILDPKIKDTFENCPVGSASKEPPSSFISDAAELQVKSTGKVFDDNTFKHEEPASSNGTPDADGAILDFDLNEGITDDMNQGELAISTAAVCSSPVYMATSPFSNPMSNGSHAPITVAAAAKGSFVPPESLLKSKSEPGWRGSAATSAFRPAEPRKVLETAVNGPDIPPSDAVTKQGRPAFDIDLNVAAERVLEDISTQGIGSVPGTVGNKDASSRNAGLDLDLNRTDDDTECVQVLAHSNHMSEMTLLPLRTSRGFPDGDANMLRNFDLNNGPNVEDCGIEHGPKSHPLKNVSVPFVSPIPGQRLNSTEVGSVSTWFPQGSSYPNVAMPSFLSDRGEQPYPILAAPGALRFFGPVTGGTFGNDIYRGPVLSSSPAMAYSPATTFPYAGLPFGPGFPLSSTSFSGGSTSFVDSTHSGASCFPVMPPHFLGPAGPVPSHYPRPYMMNLPECSPSVESDSSRKWNRQGGLDLNAGPGNADADGKDDRLHSASRQAVVTTSQQAFVEEQARLLGVPSGALKRKEPDGGWDADRSVYKQLQWQ